MEQRITCITLGVADVAKARAFYEKLGWRAGKGGDANVAFFQLNGLVLGLFGKKDLAHDAGVARPGIGFGNVSIAHNVGSAAEVRKTITQAKRAGATILRKPSKAFWGGYTAYFADPDGHAWEAAYNPFWKLDSKGNVKLPK